MRVIFLGTPAFAVPTLENLISFPDTEVVAVVTQPDRPAGRGNKMHPPPTKLIALEHDIPVLQPEKLSRSPDTVQAMRELEPALIVMVAFGQILKKEVLNLPPRGVINVHASLLPSYRGAAPINWMIINGDTVGGVTTMFTEAGVDTGPMLLKAEVPIGPELTAEELANELSIKGANLLIETVKQLIAGTLVAERQDDSKATFAPMLTKELGRVDWLDPSQKIHNLVRGLIPWPGAFTTFKDSPLKILRTSVGDPGDHAEAGALIKISGGIAVACGPSGVERLNLLEVQPVNKAKMSARDWANGARIVGAEKLQ